jgi:hypothetical protein
MISQMLRNAWCTLICAFEVSAVEAKEGATIYEASHTCAIADEHSLELVVGSFLKEGNAVWIDRDDILAIFWESLICRVMRAVVQHISAFFRTPRFAIPDFDAKLSADITDYIDRTIRGLLFELFGDLVCDISTAGLGVSNVIDTKAGMLVIVRFDAKNGGSSDRRAM